MTGKEKQRAFIIAPSTSSSKIKIQRTTHPVEIRNEKGETILKVKK